MRKIIILFLIVFINSTYAQSNHVLKNLASAKIQQVAAERTNGSLNVNSVNSLPEQDLAGAIPVCQTVYNVLNSYSGYGLISEIYSNTCLKTNENNSVWYSLTAVTVGRLKFMITPVHLIDDYDYALYDVTGHPYSDIKNGLILPVICNFSALNGKTGLDSSGINNSEDAGGLNYNPLLNLIQGHTYLLNISNFYGSTFGYKLNFAGTTANIGGANSSIQNVVSYCDTDSLLVNLSSPILNSSIASNGSDFGLANSTGTYNVISAQGISGGGFSTCIRLKIGSLLSGPGTFSLSLVNGTDGNTLLNVCNNMPMDVVTSTYTSNIALPYQSAVCQNQSFTLSALSATSYTWTGALVPSSDINNQSLSIATNTVGSYSFTLQTTGNCGVNTQTFSIVVNPTPSVVITSTAAISCANTPINLHATGADNYFWTVMNPSYDANSINYQTGNSTSYFSAIPLQQNIYKVTGTTTLGCSSVAIYTLSVIASPTISVLGPDTICNGTSAILTFSGAADSYTWSTGAVNVATISVTPLATTNYYVSGTMTSTGCNLGGSTYNNKVVVVNNIKINNDAFISICYGDSVKLVSSLANSYSWSTGETTRTITVKPIANQVYSLTGMPFGCSTQSTSTFVFVNSLPNIPISMSPTVCSSSSSTYYLNATTFSTGITTYSWSTGNTSYYASGTHPYTSSNNIFTLSLTATNGNGCVNSNSLTYTVFPVPILSTSISNDICTSNTATLSVTGANSYTWTPGNLLVANAVVSPSVTTTYNVNGKDANGCYNTASVSVGISSSTVIAIAVSPSVICAGSTASLSVTGNGIFKWYKSDTTTQILVTNLSYVTPTLSAGTYTYYVSSTCTSPTRLPVIVNVLALPTINIITTSTTVCKSTPFQIFASGANTYTTYVSPISYNDTIPVVQIFNLQTYYVYGTGANGCSNTGSITISLFPTTAYITPVGVTSICKGSSKTFSMTGTPTYTWSNGVVGIPITLTPTVSTNYSVSAIDVSGCLVQKSFSVSVMPTPNASITVSGDLNCLNATRTLTLSSLYNGLYNWTGPGPLSPNNTNTITANLPGTYNCTITVITSMIACTNTATAILGIDTIAPIVSVALSSNTVCEGTSTNITASGANSYWWSTGVTTNSITETPIISLSNYTVTGTNLNGCSDTKTVSIIVNNTCADVWPGDANSDGIANNLDVLELGLHYTQTGTPRAATNNNWQSYFANNWIGTITNGANLNHSDCNGDGTINNDDTLAIYNNYGLNHAFKPAQTNTVNPQLSIVPDQASLTKGTWGTASIYLGNATSIINNINGVAFTVDFDNTLIEPNSIWIEYMNSFIDASPNLYFRKLNFANSKLFTASTHTVSNNVNGFGKIATLHYQISSSLVTDQVLNLGLSQANQSDSSGTISPLTSSTATLMASVASVGVKEILNTGNISISPNPTNGLLSITSTNELQNIEVTTIAGQVLLSQSYNSKSQILQLQNFAEGIYFVKVVCTNGMSVTKKVVVYH